jgi:hypothetical protein
MRAWSWFYLRGGSVGGVVEDDVDSASVDNGHTAVMGSKIKT